MRYDKRRNRWTLFFVVLVLTFLVIMGIRAVTSDGSVMSDKAADSSAKKGNCHYASEYTRSRSFAFHTTLTWARLSVSWCTKNGVIISHNTTLDYDSPGTGWSLEKKKLRTNFKKWGGAGRGSFHAYATLSFHQTFPVVGEVDTDYMWLRVNVFGNGRSTTDDYEHSERRAP